jgi:hypothetical protein
MKKRFEYKILDIKYNVWTGKFNEDEIVKPKLRIRNLLRKKMSSNLKMYSIFYPHCTKSTFAVKIFRAFPNLLTFFLSLQSLMRILG